MMDAGFAIEIAAKGALVLAAACVVYALMWRYAAAQRHLVLAAAMLGVLMIPVFAVVLPNVTMPIRATAIEEETPAAAGASTFIARPTTRAIEPRTIVTGEAAIAASSVSQTTPASSFSWMGFLTILWAAGFAASLMPLMIGFLGIRAVRRSGTTLTDPAWTGALRAARVGLRLTTPVTLIESPLARVPMTWGVFRAVVALPESAQDWSPQRRQVVLCHELAHIQRRDFLTQLIARVACAAHWFNPLSWWTLRAMSLERERACDDLVVESGVRAPDYAEHLLQIVRDMRGASLTARTAIAMAGHSRLEQRVRALLDTTQSRRTLSAGARIATAGAALACVAFVAMLQPTAVAEEANSDDDTKIVIRISDDGENVKVKKRVRQNIRVRTGGRRNRSDNTRTEHRWDHDSDLGAILETVSEVLEDFDIDIAIEKVLRTLEREDVQGHIERALEHLEDVDINAEIKNALEGLGEIEVSAEDVEDPESVDRDEIRRHMREMKRQLQDVDIDVHLEEVFRHLEDIDFDSHIEAAIEEFSQNLDSQEWDQILENLLDAAGNIDIKGIQLLLGEKMEEVSIQIEPILEAALKKVKEIDVDAIMDTLSDKIAEIEVIVESKSPTAGSAGLTSQADIESLLTRDNLRRVNLRRAKLSGLDLSGKDLRGARLAGADLREANLEGADLRDADLSGANLREANLRNAKLSGALLDGANLRDADLHGVSLHGVDLSVADTRGAHFGRSSHNSN